MANGLTSNHRLTVLLANEQEGWHQTIRQLLSNQGVETVSARSGREALNLLESRAIHVAVLDQQMPQLGGLQVIKLLREWQSRQGEVTTSQASAGQTSPGQTSSGQTSPGHASAAPALASIPPAILLANQLTSSLLHEALGMHVFSVLSKPVDFNVLLDTLARVLRRHYENRWPSAAENTARFGESNADHPHPTNGSSVADRVGIPVAGLRENGHVNGSQVKPSGHRRAM
jgi:CheY-like chemotaxis protein